VLWTGSAVAGFLVTKRSCVGPVAPDRIAAIKLVDEVGAHRTHLQLLQSDWQACNARWELQNLRSRSEPAMIARYISIELSTFPRHPLSMISLACFPTYAAHPTNITCAWMFAICEVLRSFLTRHRFTWDLQPHMKRTAVTRQGSHNLIVLSRPIASFFSSDPLNAARNVWHASNFRSLTHSLDT